MSASSFQRIASAALAVAGYQYSSAFGTRKSLFLCAMVLSCAVPAASQAGTECLIATSKREPFLVVQVIGKSTTAASGTYRLVLLTHGAGGTSESVQQGSFDLQPGSDRILATTMVAVADKVDVSARLQIETDRGASQCGLSE
ncbi:MULTISPECIES: curli-like amyloid fiber formation chaperone CsgH [unclassified Rhizobium]|uniref:curli-like amyloid fiber formation chaperone CsgH n=1 Tax=unclassified Rhizobium TaxID=2613769 RepID=UPI0038031CDA